MNILRTLSYVCLASYLTLAYAEDQAHEIRMLRNQVEFLKKQNFSQKIEQLEVNLGKLENKIEELNHRMTHLKPASPPSHTPANPKTPSPSQTSEDDQHLYHQAITALKTSQRSQAEKDLKKLIHTYPHSKWISQSYYWLGEIHFQNKAYTQANNAFKKVIQHYPKSPKRPDALLKAATIALDQHHTQQATQWLEMIVRDYAENPLAAQARSALKKLKTKKTT